MNVMLLAAGEGTRLRPYTEVLPKPAIPFLTVPLAAHALSFLSVEKINKLVVNTYHLPAKIHELFHNLPHGANELHFSDEVGQILGSGGGLGKSRKHFLGGGDFVMMNADEVILPKDSFAIRQALTQHKNQHAIATLLVIDHPGVGTQFGGVWTDAKGKVLGFGKSPITGSVKAWHFVGVQILSESVFEFIPTSGESNILYDALTAAIEKGHLVNIFPFECAWFETGNPKDFLEASIQCFDFLSSSDDSFQKVALKKTLEQFGERDLEIKTSAQYKKLVSPNAVIDPSAKIEGLFIAGKGSKVLKEVYLKNAIVGNQATVPNNTHAEDRIFI